MYMPKKINKTDRHYITEILFQASLSLITLTLTQKYLY